MLLHGMESSLLHHSGLLVSLDSSDYRSLLKTLSDGFTTRRSHMNGYTSDERLVSAYAAFYLPTNMLKMAFVLAQLQPFPMDLNQPFEVVDFGCGPGTYGFALYEYLQGKTAAVDRFHFVDISSLMLKQAKKIQQLLYPAMPATFATTVPRRRSGSVRLLLLGNVVNEMGVEAFMRRFSSLAAEAVILIEPGTKASFEQVAMLRTALLREGYVVQYPCPGQETCPAAEGEGEWCHQVLKAELSPEVARLGQLAQLDRTVMPFIGHVYSRQPTLSSVPLLYRLKSHSKHAFFWEACMRQNEALVLKSLELPKRNLSRKEQKGLLKVNAGERLSFDISKELTNGVLRIDNPVFRMRQP